MTSNLFFTQKALPNVYTMQPESWECVEQAVSILKSGQVVLFNLESLPADLAQRMTDFTSGCLCAIAGQQVKIGRDVVMFCPPNIRVSTPGIEDTCQSWATDPTLATDMARHLP
ncbi:cell division protein SepF [Lyngbya confervoides]|uniref:Cell division protein SepF n=1 Tax=Lyngbya confervoides BDU141951 TaxID=1574623 RepID=A0ABD4T714_9CYAN|nr:cell division protein SepF [Lyngbya confervoides]MCM1984270.1 cell division protein SepF [Lyngbya confervoides BDU141951]